MNVTYQNMSENKPLPSQELSLKYIAWDVKAMSKSLAELCEILRALQKTIEQKQAF